MKFDDVRADLRKGWRIGTGIVLIFLLILMINPRLPVVNATIAPRALAVRVAQASTPGLKVQGVTLVDTAGSRFIVSGVNMEMYRDYANGCDWVTDGQYAVRGVMADRIKALGVNAVRLNYAYRFLAQGTNLAKFLDMAEELTKRGMYVMPTDHTYTGDTLVNASAAYPMMLKIIDGMRLRGLESYLIMNPYNEPGPDVSASQWVAAQKNVLINIRTAGNFKGVVVLDGTGWSTLLDVNVFKEVMVFDATLNGGTPNVAFSNHLYPNIRDLPAKIWSAAKDVPLVIGELGQENPGASPLDPAYVRNVISGALSTGIPAGHNGLFAWIWAWCDINGMLDDWTNPSVPYSAASPLTSHGTLWRDNYYSKLPGSSIPTPLPPPATSVGQPTGTPTPTRTATRTILPTNTPRSPTPTRTQSVIVVTNTPIPSVTPLATAAPSRTPSGTEVWTIKGKVGGWDVDLLIERVK